VNVEDNRDMLSSWPLFFFYRQKPLFGACNFKPSITLQFFHHSSLDVSCASCLPVHDLLVKLNL
jgi:hypothetical protein